MVHTCNPSPWVGEIKAMHNCMVRLREVWAPLDHLKKLFKEMNGGYICLKTSVHSATGSQILQYANQLNIQKKTRS